MSGFGSDWNPAGASAVIRPSVMKGLVAVVVSPSWIMVVPVMELKGGPGEMSPRARTAWDGSILMRPPVPVVIADAPSRRPSPRSGTIVSEEAAVSTPSAFMGPTMVEDEPSVTGPAAPIA